MMKYTQEQVDFIKEHSPHMTRRELTDLFNSHYGTELSVDSIQWVCKSRKIKAMQIGFQKGICPYNARKYKIGDEFFAAGEWRVITSTEPHVPILKRSEYKKRIIWKQAHGEIPKNHRFIYLDGNKRNCTLENLECIPILYMRILNQNGWLNGNREVTLTALEWCKLHYSLSVKIGNRYVKQDGKRYR